MKIRTIAAVTLVSLSMLLAGCGEEQKFADTQTQLEKNIQEYLEYNKKNNITNWSPCSVAHPIYQKKCEYFVKIDKNISDLQKASENSEALKTRLANLQNLIQQYEYRKKMANLAFRQHQENLKCK